MSTKNYLKHTVTNIPPTFSDVGDEYYNSTTNTLYKKVVFNGTNVAWTQIVLTGVDGNINLTGNGISFLANNKYPIYFGSTSRTNTSNNTYVGINTTGYFNSFGQYYSATNSLPIYNTSYPEPNISIYFQPRGLGGILTSVPDPTYSTGADGHPGTFRGPQSVDLQLGRYSPTSVASGQFSAILGGYDNKVNGQGAAAIAGSGNSVSGYVAVAVGGQSNYVDGQNSVILGGNYAWTRNTKFYNVLTSSGIAYGSAGSNAAYAQGAILSYAGTTTAASPTRLMTTDGSSANATSTAGSRNVLVLPTNSLFAFKGTMVAAVTGGSGAGNAVWTFEGSIARGATAASTVLLGVPAINVISTDSVALTNGWYFTITSDTTNGALQINVRGDTTNGIRWYCRLETTEVSYS
jgi:hypothetical protein